MTFNATVTAHRWLTDTVFVLTLHCPEISSKAKPGQFIQVKTHFLLRRPFAIMTTNSQTGQVEIGVQMVGQGTRELSQVKVGDELSILGPLGKGFELQSDHAIIIGGGSGVFPLLNLAQSASENQKITVILGFQSPKRVILRDEFAQVSNEMIVASETGGLDIKGRSGDALADYLMKLDATQAKQATIYACGPIGMLQSIVKQAKEHGIPSFVSLEVRMGCGFGVCRGCPVDLYHDQGIERVRCCVEGPVFPGESVVFDSLLGETGGQSHE